MRGEFVVKLLSQLYYKAHNTTMKLHNLNLAPPPPPPHFKLFPECTAFRCVALL